MMFWTTLAMMSRQPKTALSGRDAPGRSFRVNAGAIAHPATRRVLRRVGMKATTNPYAESDI